MIFKYLSSCERVDRENLIMLLDYMFCFLFEKINTDNRNMSQHKAFQLLSQIIQDSDIKLIWDIFESNEKLIQQLRVTMYIYSTIKYHKFMNGISFYANFAKQFLTKHDPEILRHYEFKLMDILFTINEEERKVSHTNTCFSNRS